MHQQLQYLSWSRALIATKWDYNYDYRLLNGINNEYDEMMEALYKTRLDIENSKRMLDQSHALVSMFIYRPQSLEY